MYFFHIFCGGSRYAPTCDTGNVSSSYPPYSSRRLKTIPRAFLKGQLVLSLIYSEMTVPLKNPFLTEQEKKVLRNFETIKIKRTPRIASRMSTRDFSVFEKKGKEGVEGDLAFW